MNIQVVGRSKFFVMRLVKYPNPFASPSSPKPTIDVRRTGEIIFCAAETAAKAEANLAWAAVKEAAAFTYAAIYFSIFSIAIIPTYFMFTVGEMRPIAVS